MCCVYSYLEDGGLRRRIKQRRRRRRRADTHNARGAATKATESAKDVRVSAFNKEVARWAATFLGR